MDEMDRDINAGAMDDDEFLRQLLPDPGNPELTVLSGVFFGKGTDENTVRLYTTYNLSQYFQLPQDKVLGAKRLPGGRVVIWVPHDVRVQLTTSQTMTAEFLKGSLQAAYLSRARRTSSFGSLGRRSALQDEPQPSVFGGPFCGTDIPDPENPICGLTHAGCPPGPGC